MSQGRKHCRQLVQPRMIKAPQGCKSPEGTIVGKSPGMTCLQSSTRANNLGLKTTTCSIYSSKPVPPV